MILLIFNFFGIKLKYVTREGIENFKEYTRAANVVVDEDDRPTRIFFLVFSSCSQAGARAAKNNLSIIFEIEILKDPMNTLSL